MSAPYPYMNGTLITSDLSQIFVYLDTVTSGLFMPFTMLFFFCVTLITSLIMQQRFTGNMRIETSVLAASFVSTGLSMLLLINGMIMWQIPIASAAIFILSLIWVTNTAPAQ